MRTRQHRGNTCNYKTHLKFSRFVGQRGDVARAVYQFQRYYQTKQEQRDEECRRDKCWKRWTTIAAVVAAAATVSAACFTFGSWRAAVDSADSAKRSLPRSWLYIEFPTPLDVRVTYASLPPEYAGKRSFSVSLHYSFRNYGQVPATISSVQTYLFVPNTPILRDIAPYNSRDEVDDSLSVASDRKAELSFNGLTIASEASSGAFGMSGVNQATLSNIGVSTAEFVFLQQPDILWHVEVLPKWVNVVVHYTDPDGAKRETSYLGKIEGSRVIQVNDPRHNSHL